MLWTGTPSSLNSWRSWVKASRWLPSARAAMPRARRARAAISPLSARPALASTRSACLRAASESARRARTVAAIKSAAAAVSPVWFASVTPAASAAASWASSQRPVSMNAHPSEVRPGALVPCVPGARSRCMASCSDVIARSDSSRTHAAEPIRHTAGSSRGERLAWRRYETSSLLLPNGSVLACIKSLCGPTSARDGSL